MRLCIQSIRGLVPPLVGPLLSNAFVEIDEKWPFEDSKRFIQRWTRKKETRRKEGRRGRRDEEEGGTRRRVKK